MTVRLSPAHVTRLDFLCVRYGLSRSDLVAKLLDRVADTR